MSCNQCVGIEMEFDDEVAKKELLQYQNEGPPKVNQLLIDALLSEGVSEMTLLDIGGGVGATQHELLKAGVSTCINVEASRAYLDAAKEEAERQGHAERIEFLYGNFVDLAADIPKCDIVTMDRVICCYHDVESLVEKSTVLAKNLYGLVYPRDTLWSKVLGTLDNLKHWLQRSPFRFFVHPTAVVEEILHKNGFERLSYQEEGMWQIVVFGRVDNMAE